jgi:hypothetical protein
MTLGSIRMSAGDKPVKFGPVSWHVGGLMATLEVMKKPEIYPYLKAHPSKYCVINWANASYGTIVPQDELYKLMQEIVADGFVIELARALSGEQLTVWSGQDNQPVSFDLIRINHPFQAKSINLSQTQKE